MTEIVHPRPVPTYANRMAAAIALTPASVDQDDVDPTTAVRQLAADIMLDAARDLGPAAIERYITNHRDDIPVSALAGDDVVEDLLNLIGTADLDVGWDTTTTEQRLRAERDQARAALAEIGRRATAADAGDADTLRGALRAIAAQAQAAGDAPKAPALDAETSTEWTWRHNRYVSTASATTDRAEAERSVAQCRAAKPGDPVVLVRRTVTRWTDAEDASACPDEWQPYHELGSRPDHCATCCFSTPRPGSRS